MKNFFYLSLSVALLACSSTTSQEPKKKADLPAKDSGFNDYWYAGVAEITSYELKQARYGEIHQGEAVLVYVTEPFSKSKQVKLDNWRDTSSDNVSVMKLNMTKKFLTGIYPYSMMMSSFTPVSYDKYSQAFKVTTSSQEWCGHTWMQLNLEKDSYRLKGFSYFESEGDIDTSLRGAVLEDELWSKLRLNPEILPRGDFELIPSTFYLRLKHKEAGPQKANAKIEEVSQSDYADYPHDVYKLSYKGRSLQIFYEKSFPHEILGWEETYQGQTTTAKRINTIKSAYWGKNSNADRAIREELGLSVE